MFCHNTSHLTRWNRNVCNAPTSPDHPRNLPSFVWSQHKWIREISDCHFILFCARRWTRDDDVNLSIPWWRNFSRRQKNIFQNSYSLPPIYMLRWKLEHCCLPNKLIIVSFWLSFKICKSITRCCTFICKKGPRSTFVHFTQNKSYLLQSYHLKLNHVSPPCIGHVDGTNGLLTWYFLLVLPTQWVKTFAQNQNLWQIGVDLFKLNHKPL